MTHILQESFQRTEALPELQPDTGPQTGCVRSTEDPIVVTTNRMGPEGRLPFVQMDAQSADRQLSEFAILDRMNRGEALQQPVLADALFLPSTLDAHLGLPDARLDSLDPVPSGKRPPRADPVALQNYVGVHEHRPGVSWHDGSQLHGTGHPMCFKRVREILESEIEQPGNRPWAMEVKRGQAPKLEGGFWDACEDIRPSRRFVAYPGTERFGLKNDVEAIGVADLMREVEAGSAPAAEKD